MRHVIVGCGAAGVSAAERIHQERPDDEITLIYDDTDPFYYRAALSFFTKGEITEKELVAKPLSWYEENGIDLLQGQALSLDPDRKVLTLEDHRKISYDKLLIASGSEPFVPPWAQGELKGVHTYRTIACAKKIMEEAEEEEVKEVVVVGGGILAIEMMENFINLGLSVTALIRRDVIASALLDREAAKIVEKDMEREGVRFVFNDQVEKIMGKEGKVDAVQTKEGERLPCQMVGVALGVRPADGFLEESGIALQNGVVVNKKMETNQKDVYAAGDVSVMYDREKDSHTPTGTWLKASLQGDIAGANMSGKGILYDNTFLNSSHIFRSLYAVVGDFKGGEGREKRVYKREGGIYKSVICREERIVGATFLNDLAGLWEIKALIEKKEFFEDLEKVFESEESFRSFLDEKPPALLTV